MKSTFRNRIVSYGEESADQLLANPSNWRIHPKPQQDALDGVLSDVGWVQNVIVNKRTSEVWGADQNVETLVDGHLRVALAISRNERVPITYVDLLPHEEALILSTIDPLSALAVTDAAQLETLLQSVNSDNAAVQAMLAKLAEENGITFGDEPPEDAGAQIDRAEELQAIWQCERGQLWVIPSKTGRGVHKLLCGDSTNAEDVARVMGGERADICFTSPPYNMGENAKTDGYLGKCNASKYRSVNADDLSGSSYFDLLEGFTHNALNNCQYVFVNIQMLAKNKVVLIDYLHHFKSNLGDIAIWSKTQAQPAFAENIFTSAFEFILCFTNEEYPSRAIHTGQFDRGMLRNVYQSGNASQNEFFDMHAATFPIEFVSWGINNFSNKLSGVYDPFLGSGTTLVACEQTGRQGRGIEIEPRYCAVILQRMQDLGLTPQLAE